MEPIAWSDDLLLEFEPMDSVHRDFIGVLAAAQAAADPDLLAAWTAVIEHTRAHFAREDDWMCRTRFASADSHMLQHRVVLNVLREGLALAREGRFDAVREMATELAAWFAKHAQTQDAALALHLRRGSSPRPTTGAARQRASAGATPPR